MQDAWRAYLEMALGLTEAPRKRAQQVAGELVNRGGATAAQLQGLVEDLMSTGMANREALTNLIRYEVDRALGKVGLATNDEVAELTARVRDLEQRLRAAQGPAEPAPLPGKVAKKAVAKKAVTPNAMPTAATTPGAARKAAEEAVTKAAARRAAEAPPAAGPVGTEAVPGRPPARKAAKKAGPVGAEAVDTPVKKAAPGAKKAGPVGTEAVDTPVKKAAPGAKKAGPVGAEVVGSPVKKAAPVGKKAVARKVAPRARPEARS